MISSGIAIEMINNHLHKGKLGKCPNFVRGIFGSNYQFHQYENSKYENCTACSLKVLSEYVKNKKDFLINSLNNPKILNKYSGFDEEMEKNIDDIDAIVVLD